MPRHRPAPAVTSGAEMMKTVKAAWDKAPAGPKKDAALKHYQAAEAALKAHNEQGCIAALKQAQAALKQAQATERAPPTGRGSLSRSGGAGSVPERGHLRDRR